MMGLRGKAVLAVAVLAIAGGHTAAGHARAAGHAMLTSIHAGGSLDCAQLERLWESAGGSRAAAFMAAEIAIAESGGQQYATDNNTNGSTDRGYWQINDSHVSLSTYDAYANARAAVIISNDGTDWTPWTTYTSGAYAGRC